jgi:subtilisin family serine protease
MKAFPERFKHPSGFTGVIEPTRAVIAFKERTRSVTKKGLVTTDRKLSRLGLVRENVAQEKKTRFPKLTRPVNDTRSRLWITTGDKKAIGTAALKEIPRAFAGEIAWVGPVYRPARSRSLEDMFCPLPNVLIIKPRAGLSEERVKTLEKALKRLGLNENREKSRYLGAYRYFEIKNPRAKTSFDLKAIIEQDLGNYVAKIRFEEMPLLTPYALTPDDTLFPRQWNLEIIDAPDAWNSTVGLPSVVVAILDSGCDFRHVDLRFHSRGINLDTMAGDGSPADSEAHGTCCAGIAAATINNERGIAGVAGNCRILPLAMVNPSYEQIEMGIRYAAEHGACVISMSFVLSSTRRHEDIDAAIEYAHNEKGCVLCAATGNYDDDHIRYPALHPLVIACGASSTDDNRKNPDSPDGEDWGSSYGDGGVSVVAPGVRITTTDIWGTQGYDLDAYYPRFNGTSAATPHVAGLAALILSINPFLSNVEVRDIIERTADKTGQLPYNPEPGYPNGTRNREMGYGRINAREAVTLACEGFAAVYNVLFGIRR